MKINLYDSTKLRLLNYSHELKVFNITNAKIVQKVI